MDEYFTKLEFDNKKIDYFMNQLDESLNKYINDNIIFEYELNDKGHNINHIYYVLKRAFEIAPKDINANILFTCVMFHDIACHIDRENHEKLSSERAYNDSFLNKFFDENQMNIIRDAIYDHRASLQSEPRNIYGKILSSADRKVEIKEYLISSISFRVKQNHAISKDEVIKGSYEFAIKKFGKNGYAVNKSYLSDGKYEKFLNDLQFLIDNKEKFYYLASIVYDELEVKNNEKSSISR